jgi:hypothetical protein
MLQKNYTATWTHKIKNEEIREQLNKAEGNKKKIWMLLFRKQRTHGQMKP